MKYILDTLAGEVQYRGWDLVRGYHPTHPTRAQRIMLWVDDRLCQRIFRWTCPAE